MNFPAKATITLLGLGIFFGLWPTDQQQKIMIREQSYPVYPQTQEQHPAISSPYRAQNGTELVAAKTLEGRWALVDVTVPDWNRTKVNYFGYVFLSIDKEDFPALARSGLHAEKELKCVKTITGRTLAEINQLSRPGVLSTAGFLAEDEDLLSVLLADNRLVKKLGFTHPQMARPLLHMWNLILQEQKHGLGRWGKGHAWIHFDHFLYRGKKISYEAHFTKGGQKSPFADGIEGAVHVFLKREIQPAETEFLENKYRRLGPDKLQKMKNLLFGLTCGEMQPFYILRYGFYEGHIAWRTDPIAIASIFGLRSIEELEASFPNKLDQVLFGHYLKKDPKAK